MIQSIELVLVLAAVVLAGLALRCWLKFGLKELPLWRNLAAITSFLITFLAFAAFLAPVITTLTGSNVSRASEMLFSVIPAIGLAGLLLGCTLKKRARIYIISANLLLGVLWWSSYVS